MEENFDVGNYGTSTELWLDVEKRFTQDGMYLPPEAKQHIEELWEGTRPESVEPAGIFQSGLDELISPISTEPPLTMPTEDFLEGMRGPLPEMLQPAPITPTKAPTFSFGNIGKAFTSMFKRLFRI